MIVATAALEARPDDLLPSLREAVAAHDKAREAFRAHGGSVWHPTEGWR
jgi:hypothetical protein